MAIEEQPVGARLMFWLGRACRQARVDAGVGPAEVAGRLKRGQSVVDDFELGKRVPRELDVLLAVYGEMTGRDARDIVSEALQQWYEHGSAPRLSQSNEDAVDRGDESAVRPPPAIAPTDEETDAPQTGAAGQQ